ncbi:MAG: phosphoribosylformylglycinamidine cyclo-ligase [Methanosphaera sp.]|jgi:phosphoribosylformylglycinamidine cyclo-ligase|uniref:phosphoribosylformylglycinamidine cyclo-ligase n=1 Tax=Methanosphaera TaxID=2316 RepID=UPI002380BF73|nr:phosphoribosylformylglycinamidine cyclo-ligase [Candidatus Methanosphaera massiliense]MDD6285286.1 phosphoribosylformylglycinamidine cyclo-ligase [Methanobacteriaceae archaeon]MDE4078242.1 phosphoribosylformylglycinamidine cyclo-ligase [Candidatus Methanosphaera massiliense]
MVTYSEAGVDISLEEQTVQALTGELAETIEYRNIIKNKGHFAALVDFGKKAIAMSTDGVGSKILIAKQMEKYDTVGIDCIAMVVNDILCVGAEPIAMVDYLAVEHPNPEIAKEIGKGLKAGCQQAKIAMIGGETASLPKIIKDFDLAGTGIGTVDKNKIITGTEIKDGDIILGITSSGVHSNGLSLARKALLDIANYKVTDKLPTDNSVTVGEALLEPTIIYVDPIIELLNSDVEVHGLGHITGGGFSNLKRLNHNMTYIIDNLPEPLPIFKAIQATGIEDKEMYHVFNMGIGFAVILDEKYKDQALEILNKYHDTYVIGKIQEDEKNRVLINTYNNENIEL